MKKVEQKIEKRMKKIREKLDKFDIFLTTVDKDRRLRAMLRNIV